MRGVPYGARRLIAELPPPVVGALGVVVISAAVAMWVQIFDLERRAHRADHHAPERAATAHRRWNLRSARSRDTLLHSLALLAVGTSCLGVAIARG